MGAPLTTRCHRMFQMCPQIFIVMAMLVRIMNWLPAMAGLLVTVIMIPASTYVGKYLGTARRAQVRVC